MESQTQVRHRHVGTVASADAPPEDESLLATIDSFIESLESRLERFESLFLKTPAHGTTSEIDLKSLYEMLVAMKQSFVDSTASKLETLQTFFSEHYSAFFDDSGCSDIAASLKKLETKLEMLDELVAGPKLHYVHYYRHTVAVQTGKTKTLHYYQLPVLWRENRYIIHGYRFKQHKRDLFKSVFGLHNETCNIWSHMCGFCLILGLVLWHLPYSEAWNRSSADKACIAVFIAAAMNCLGSSTVWHTCTGTASMAFRNRCVCIDYTGITTLITASILSAQYSSLYYFPKFQAACLAVTGVLGAMGLWLNWSPRFDRPESRKLRVTFFVFLASTGALCFFVLWFYKGFLHSLSFFSPLLPSFASYGVGVVFYSMLIPERWRTDVDVDKALPDCVSLCEGIGKDHSHIDEHFKDTPPKTGRTGFSSLWWVDYCFASHGIWHLFVLGGIVGHYFGILKMFEAIEMNQ